MPITGVAMPDVWWGIMTRIDQWFSCRENLERWQRTIQALNTTIMYTGWPVHKVSNKDPD